MIFSSKYKWKFFLTLIFKGQILWLLTLLILQIFAGVSPVMIAWLNSHLIDNIAGSYQESVAAIDIYSKIIIVLIISSASLIAFSDLFLVLQNFLSDYFTNLVYKRVEVQLLKAVSSYPTNYVFEDPEINNTMILAKDNVKQVSDYISISSQVLVMVFGFISAIILGADIVWWMPLLLISTMTPFIYYRTQIESKTWKMMENYSPTFNKLSLYEKILTNPEFSKDIRLYNMQDNLLKKWEKLYNEFFKAINNLRTKGVFIISLWAFISGIGPLIGFWYIGVSAIDGKISIGKLSFLLGIIIQLRGSITCLMHNSADIFRTFLMTKPVLSILGLKDEKVTTLIQTNILPSSNLQSPLLIFDDVSFVYPGSDDYVLKNLSFSLKENESIALVGENGSGKSTLLKLICRLYVPTSGKIYWRGQDISCTDFAAYRANIAALFQDFAKFPITVRENIEVCPNTSYSEDLIKRTLKDVGLEFLQKKLDVSLFKGIEGSIELSGGEWQKLALTRLLNNMQNRDLLLFDEPTAAIDPNTEYSIFSLLRNQIIGEKSLIITSHRLALCQFVNNIIVLKDGCIVEQGDHKKLLNLKALYYEMFQNQACWYKEI